MSDSSLSPSYKVLVVDDTATNRQILEVFLKRLGYQPIQACDGAQALEMFDAEQPDLVLMDVMMPVMDGFEATRRLKERESTRWVPVVFISAMDKDENLVAGLEAGGDDYLFKPVNFVVLKAKLKSITRTLELHRQVEEATRQLQTISDSLVDGLITIDRHATILSVNPAVENIFGYEACELIGQNINILMPEPYRSEHDRYVREYVMGGMPKIIGTGQRDLKGRRKSGEIFHLDLAISETRINGERVFIGTVRDTSERMTNQDRLNDALELSGRMIEASPYGIAAYAPRGECIFANNTAAEVLGATLGQLQQRNFRELQYWQETGMLKAAESVLAGGKTALVETHSVNNFGKKIWISCYFTSFMRGAQRHLLTMFNDISERKAGEVREREYLDQLKQYRERQEVENALAYEILMRQVNRPGFNDPAVHHWLSPAAEVSGDVVAAVRSPNGELLVMLADATGHGLAASISTSPVLTLFYEMAEWGLVLSAIVGRINDQLCSALPSSRFVAAAFISIDESKGTAQVWVGGTPPVLLLDPDGHVCRRFEPDRLPLGIAEMDNEHLAVTEVAWVTGSQFALCSDGLQEAANEAGNAFGNERIEQALAAAPAAKRIEGVRNALRAFTKGAVPHDDVSLLLVDCLARE